MSERLLIKNRSEVVLGLWASSVEEEQPFTESGVSNAHDGYITEMLKVGQAASEPGGDKMIASPYSDRLRPLFDVKRIMGRSNVYLSKLRFRAFDTTKEGATPPQDADTLTAIFDSLDTVSNAYVQSRFLNGEVGGWQPNWFRPEVIVDSRVILDSQSTNFGNHRGDLSIGLSLPWCSPEGMLIYLGRIDSKIEVSAQAVQKVGDTYQRYLVVCEAEFVIYESNA